ncbi:aminoacyl-tRNA hydrolase [Aquibacillus koreensis]|uniref:Peptidyl-tRNA hydrolase n=1 Tax=Aquibacillus koreensis TaxID=279446 RepID=A0A9X3WMG5_9BACI|nr:aminoacyl-tRNA hydrolase [Aquibacillus koreensis]MCT2534313.1 aminoacyl-tRNA hydrolase [Aquibacillus koreensis]MDC3422390.1 aminoacyl-tRNA hydrolase [Aquibacillus koreensis]
MKCIVGLGNPGRKYAKTRHNIGFMVIDEMAKRYKWKLNKKKFNGIYAIEAIGTEKVLLLEPQTFMNLSGESLQPLIDFYDIAIEDIVVIYDDLDLPPGKIRLRQKGGHGGHNGIRSIIDQLGTKEFKRIRVGIGRPQAPISVTDYVLGKFSDEDTEEIENSIDRSIKACEAWMNKPFQEVMNEYNQ